LPAKAPLLQVSRKRLDGDRPASIVDANKVPILANSIFSSMRLGQAQRCHTCTGWMQAPYWISFWPAMTSAGQKD
jgi:hypothetical protein